MFDELLKTIILGAPNFVGFIFAIWILNTRLTKQDEALAKLTEAMVNCLTRSEQVKGASFPKENAEQSEAPLTAANEPN